MRCRSAKGTDGKRVVAHGTRLLPDQNCAIEQWRKRCLEKYSDDARPEVGPGMWLHRAYLGEKGEAQALTRHGGDIARRWVESAHAQDEEADN